MIALLDAFVLVNDIFFDRTRRREGKKYFGSKEVTVKMEFKTLGLKITQLNEDLALIRQLYDI